MGMVRTGSAGWGVGRECRDSAVRLVGYRSQMRTCMLKTGLVEATWYVANGCCPAGPPAGGGGVCMVVGVMATVCCCEPPARPA